MSNKTPKKAKGREFKPREPYTHRLRKILEDYPDGSQVLREILQNSDDAKSTEQIFILDHNTYPKDNLFEPDLDNYNRTDLKLDRYQGPALLAKNNTIFEERDFQSLLKLADSEKRDQYDKIGVMGVGFNSIYHITDSPSFITGDKYVILDPHEWYFNGGVEFDFVDEKLYDEYPNQFAPFRIPCDKSFKGTIFRYPLRTDDDSIDSDISKKIYKPDEILAMFQKFYEKESINCLLFLKYIERISFYELKEGESEPILIYSIQLENANQVRNKRRLIVKNIVSIMSSLKSTSLPDNNQSQASYVATFSRQNGDFKEPNSSWLILNYLDNLKEAEALFKEKLRDYKFVPNVGLAVPLDNLNDTGRLFCFLPLPISMPFCVSVHGYFAVSTNRRSLWSAADKEDLAEDGSAHYKVMWNRYLFENVLPKAWAKFLCELPLKAPNIEPKDLYKFWPIVKVGTGSINTFCKDLLRNVINCLSINDRVFQGPPTTNPIGEVVGILASSYKSSQHQQSKFHWLSLSHGYLKDEFIGDSLSKIIGEIGFPIITIPLEFVRILKNSNHNDFINFYSPVIIRNYLSRNRCRWEDKISREKVLQLFDYILEENKEFDKLIGFKMIPLANGTLGALMKSNNSCVYIGPTSTTKSHEYDEENIFKNQLEKFVDKNISSRLYNRLYDIVKKGWNLNIKILDESVIADMIRFSLNPLNDNGRNFKSIIGNFIGKKSDDEIQILNNNEWIYILWKNFKYRDWDLTKFEDIHLIPTNHSTLRKLKTPQKIFSNQTSKDITISKSLINIFEKFGAVFVDNEFDNSEISKWNKISSFIIKPDDIISVLNSFLIDPTYPKNLDRTLQNHEALAFVEHLSNYLRLIYNRNHIDIKLIQVIKHLPIFIEIDNIDKPISLLPGNKQWYLLPHDEEKSYGKIIYPNDKGGFLSTTNSQNFLLEDIIKITRLNSHNYWKIFVLPYIKELRDFNDLDKVIDKLFDRLPTLLANDENFKDILGNISFVPASSIKTLQNQQIPYDTKLVKPTELFDPKEKSVIELFFDNEQVFPAGKYEKEWIPTIDMNEKIKFSRSDNCYCQKDKDLIGLISPIIKTKVNKKFLKFLRWDNYPKVEKVLEQLIFCYKLVLSKQSPKNLEDICMAIYKYINEIFDSRSRDYKSNVEFEIIKKALKTHPWILCGEIFYPAEKVVFNLPNKFHVNNSIIVELPTEYNRMKSLFRYMGVRDEIGIKDLILVIQNMVKVDKDKILSAIEITNIIRILEHIAKIQKENKREGIEREKLDGLLIPSTEDTLVNLHEIQFDDMEDRLDDDEKKDYKLAHRFVTLDIAKELELQTLAGKITGISNTGGDINWDAYEQNELLTTRIKHIIEDYPTSSIFKEFLQNADDAKATHFSIIVDERKPFCHNKLQKSFLSEEMEDWQGPAIWIYNDAEFTSKDFQSLIKLGVGGKSDDDTKIGRFGIGFNCAFHLTDLPSFVSGKYIAFLDPNAKYLPAQGYPPRRFRGNRFNFIDLEFKKHFPDQCYPYEALGCDFTKEFKGTLFRLPLRTSKLAEQSEISKKVLKIKEIFDNFQSNNEMLFLRNVESCSLRHITNGNSDSRLIWEVKINMNDNYRNIRKSVVHKSQVYQLDFEMDIKGKKSSEIWLICTGEHDKTRHDFKKFMKNKRLKPRGGVAALLARSNKTLDNLKDESFPNPPDEFVGGIYNYLSLSMITNLSASRTDDTKINFKPHTLNNLWPIPKNSIIGLYKKYGLHVIKKLGTNDSKFFWTEANGGKFVSLKESNVHEESDPMIADLLAYWGVSSLKFDEEKLIQLKEISKQSSFPYTTIGGRTICDVIRKNEEYIHMFYQNDKTAKKEIIRSLLFLLLEFILKSIDESYEILNRLPLVPLNDGSIGKFGNVYYIGKQKYIDLFPKFGPSRFVHIDLPGALLEIFRSKKFSVQTNIRRFDSAAILDLLSLEFHDIEELDYEPNSTSIPNSKWLEEIWSKLEVDDNINFIRLSKFPLLPMIQPYEKLVQLDITNPLISIRDYERNFYPVLVKLKLRFTNKEFPTSANHNIRQCVLPFNSVNIINALERMCVSSNMSMDQLFKERNLLPKDYEKFRNYIKDNIDDLIRHGRRQDRFANILRSLRSLPIWPICSSDDKFIDAKSGILLPHNLPFFPLQENVHFYKCDNENDYNALFNLGANSIDELEYVRDHFLPQHIYTKPSEEYINFLKKVLSLENGEIEQFLKECQVIPNVTHESLVKANTLYDNTVPLFFNVFEGSDKFLAPELQNPRLMGALERIGLKRHVNANTFIECAKEIESQFRRSESYPENIVKHRAKYVTDYFYGHITSLGLTIDQLNQIMNIKFVPSEKYFQNRLFNEEAKVTLGYECFSVLCSQQYKEVCWSQRPLFEKSVEPNNILYRYFPNIGKPTLIDVIKHWFLVVEKIKLGSLTWKSSENYKVIKKIIEKIYEIMNEFSQEMIHKNIIISFITKNRLFLNGEDLFDNDNWVAGDNLVFGVQEDISKGLKKVDEFIMPYKDLLKLAGAHELEEININEYDLIHDYHDQKDLLHNNLLKRLIRHPDTKHHDVIFIVGEEGTRIGASRYVLSAASEYFEKMFCGHTAESEDNRQVEVRLDYIQSNSFRVFLRWLYGESFEEASSTLRKRTEEENYDSYYLDFLVNLLKITDISGCKPLKDIVEITIMKDGCVNINNVIEMSEWADNCKALKLKNHCEKFINLNRGLILEKSLVKNR
ncbi:3619_t:CDS:10 [Rhizophagus irregularis]|nr:3619_t:CDS:10 [Rhizophagus irregularis]